MNVQGVVKYCYDNRVAKNGQPNKFPNFKFGIDNHEIVLWSENKPSFLEKGKKLSVTVQASKKNGSYYVLNKPDKTPMMQELSSDVKIETKPDTTFNVDEFEANNFNTAVTTIEKEIGDTTINKPFNKDEFMFTMALLKSGIESSQIGVTKEEVDLKIKDYKFLFQMNFHN